MTFRGVGINFEQLCYIKNTESFRHCLAYAKSHHTSVIQRIPASPQHFEKTPTASTLYVHNTYLTLEKKILLTIQSL